MIEIISREVKCMWCYFVGNVIVLVDTRFETNEMFTFLNPHDVPLTAVCSTQSLSVLGSRQYIEVHILLAFPNSVPCMYKTRDL